MSSPPALQTFYDAVGGHETFVALVKRFYEGVASDPPLRALYPEDDLGPAEDAVPDVPGAVLGRSRPPTASSAGTPACGCGTCRSP